MCSSRVWQVIQSFQERASLILALAEFRGPGVHHNFDDSDSGYDVDMDQKSKSFGGNQRGRIILLGDGTEVLTDSDDTEMFDHGEEDKDLESQVHKSPPAASSLPEKSDVKAMAEKVAEKVLGKSTDSTAEAKPEPKEK